MNKEKGSIAGAILVILGVILTIYFIFVFPFVSWTYQTSYGEHTGYVTAVEKNGIFWKTGTAYIKSDTQSSQEDQYCVMNQDVYNDLVSASETKSHVTVEYTDWLHKAVQVCDGESAIITSVRIDK